MTVPVAIDEPKRGVSRSVRFISGNAHSMAKRGTKATRKFAASGQLTKKIQARRKHQQIQRKTQKIKGAKSRGREPAQAGDSENEQPEDANRKKARCVLLHILSIWVANSYLDVVSRACR